ncbi:MAG: hypothetical protein AAFR18_07875 [Cyanobacteria bacterium J06627_32]
MDDWLEQLQQSLNEAARESSNWFAEVSQQSNEAIEAWVDGSLEAIEAWEKALSPTLNTFNDQVDSAVDAGLLFLDQQVAPRIEEATAPLSNTITPWLQNHPTCIGCRNYHGTAYGDEMLVCGMHPYGPDDQTCADWESVWPKAEEASRR